MVTLADEPREPNFSLSRQEERVIALSMEGLGDKEIAQSMSLSLGTVRTYWKRIQSKVGGATRAEIVATVARTGTELELEKERSLNARLKTEILQRREAEAKFRAICACAPVGIYVCSANGDCLYVNPAWGRITGLPGAATMGNQWTKIVHPDDVERLTDWWKANLTGGPSLPTEFRFMTPNGMIWVRSTFSPMEIDGRVLGYVGTIEDVSNRRNKARAEDRPGEP